MGALGIFPIEEGVPKEVEDIRVPSRFDEFRRTSFA
jgi:hypothetical protein